MKRLLLIPVAAVLLDLFLGVELPGVLWLEHGVFRGTQALFDLVVTDDVRRSPLLWLLVALGPVAWGVRARTPIPWAAWVGAFQLALLGAVAAVALALLLSRAGLGLAGLGVLAVLAGMQATEARRLPRAVLVAGCAALATVALYRLLLGHHGGLLPGLRTVPYPQGHGAPDPEALATAFAFVAGLLFLLGTGAWLRSRPDRGAWQRLLAAGGLGAMLWFLARGEGAVGELTVLLSLLPGAGAAARAGWLGGDSRRWQAASGASLALIWGLACLAHAEVHGAWACPDPATQAASGLTRLGDVAKTFRTVRAPNDELLLVHRRDGFVSRWSPGGRSVLDPGSAAGSPGVAGLRFDGAPEELVAAPEIGRWFGTLDPHGALREQLGEDVSGAIWSAPFGGAVDQIHPIRGCWTNALAWDAPRSRLLITCENKPRVVLWDPATWSVDDSVAVPGSGDIVDLRWDGSGWWAASLWFSPWVSRLDAESLAPVERRFVGGGAYRVAPAGDRLLVSRFYGSRVSVLGERRSSLRTGLGTRALAVDEERDLVLVSSQFDGRLRVFDLESGERLASLPVGGDVKDIAYDPLLGRAWFAGLCGLFELDAARFSRSLRRRETR